LTGTFCRIIFQKWYYIELTFVQFLGSTIPVHDQAHWQIASGKESFRMKAHMILAVFLSFAALTLPTCNDDDDDDEPNTPPVIGEFIVPETVKPGASVTFQVIAHDNDGDVLAYAWAVDDTPLDAKPTVTWLVPEDKDGTVTVRMTVSDGRSEPRSREKLVMIESKAKEDIPWSDAVALVVGGKVERVVQLHSLKVTLYLKDGGRRVTIEPSIDEVFKVIQECGEPCADILLITE